MRTTMVILVVLPLASDYPYWRHGICRVASRVKKETTQESMYMKYEVKDASEQIYIKSYNGHNLNEYIALHVNIQYEKRKRRQ